MEEYIRLEEEKDRRRDKVYNWETAMYGTIWHDKDVHDLRYVETELPAVVFNDYSNFNSTKKPFKPNNFDCFKDFENEFPAIGYNDALTSKLYFSEPTVSPQHINEFDETLLSECDGEEQNVIYFNDLFPFNVIYLDDLKSDKNNDDDKMDINSVWRIINKYRSYSTSDPYLGLFSTGIDTVDRIAFVLLYCIQEPSEDDVGGVFFGMSVVVM
nr:hypothetical protein [Tanacetum cinerariifolium]